MRREIGPEEYGVGWVVSMGDAQHGDAGVETAFLNGVDHWAVG